MRLLQSLELVMEWLQSDVLLDMETVGREFVSRNDSASNVVSQIEA